MQIYLVPFLLDLVLFVVQSRLADAAGREMNLSNSQATSLLVAFSLVYLLACPVAARSLNERTIKPILVISLVALLLASVPLLFVVSFWPALLLIGAVGFTAAFAFNSFQAFMRGRSPKGGLAATVAKYHVSWCLGVGLGFLLSGVLRSFGQPMVLAALCSAAIVGIVWMIASEKAPLDDENDTSSTRLSEPPTVQPLTVQPMVQPTVQNLAADAVGARYVAIGWSLCLAANFVQRPLATFLPKFSAQDGHAAWMAGVLLCALVWAQAAGGYFSYRRAQWLYTPRPLVILQVGIVLSLGVLWISRSYALSLMAMIVLGVLQGFAYFCAVFYCSNNLRSAHNIGINEMMVGVGNIGGMVVCNLAIRWISNELAFYPTIIVFSLLMLAAQMWWLRDARVASVQETAAATS
jgi:MFS family permease